MKNPRTAQETEIPFEEALDRLEKIVGELERGELSLETLVSKYEEGVRLQRICEQRLQAAETRLHQIRPGPQGQPTVEAGALETMNAEPESSRTPDKGHGDW